ncbi:MAG: hypothetical protein KAS97_12555 [Candidatus Aminicenantes bacterium]|nr:hypothetical protein [Candidatus Aminicenantes bacterium]
MIPKSLKFQKKKIGSEKKKGNLPIPGQKIPDKKEKSVKKEVDKDSLSKEEIVKKKPEPVKKIKPAVDPFDKFHQGKLTESGILWNKKILSQKNRFSILLEMDCMKVSVMNAYKKSENSEKFFILNITRGNRQCFLVFFGIYPDNDSAERALNSVPKYFWKQANPPKVLDLSVYL